METIISAANAIMKLITEHAPNHPLVAEHDRITTLLNSPNPIPQQQQPPPSPRADDDCETMQDEISNFPSQTDIPINDAPNHEKQ